MRKIKFSLGKSLATLGEGNITVTDDDANGTDSLERLNRDVENTNKDLFSVDRTRGDVDLTIDTRLLSEDGRQDIANNVTDTKEFGEDVIRAVNTATTDSEVNGLGGFYKALNNNVNVTALKNDIDRNPEHDELRAKLDNKENTEVYFEGLRELSALAKNKFGIEPGELILFNGDQTTSASLQDVIASNGQVLIDTKGATTFDGTNFIDVSDADSKLDQVTTLGNELLRSAEVDGSTDLSTSSNSNTQNALSDTFGTQFGDRVDQLFEGGLDNGVSASFYNSQSSSASAVSGTQRANEVGNDAVLYRQLVVAEVDAIESIADKFAEDHGLTPDEARRELTQTALGLVDSEWASLQHIQDTTTDRAKEALAGLGNTEEPISSYLLGDGWTGSKEIKLFDPDDYFGDTYLFSNQTDIIENGVESGRDGRITSIDNEGYISRYGLPADTTQISEPSVGAIAGELLNETGESITGISTTVYDQSIFTPEDERERPVVFELIDGVVDFGGNCISNGVKCAAPEFLTHGTPSDHAVVDKLLGDSERLLESRVDGVQFGAEAVTLVGGAAATIPLKAVSKLPEFPDGIGFNINTKIHVSNVDGFSQKRGVSGGHNSDAFSGAVTDNNLKIVELGQQAAAKGYNDAISKGASQFSSVVGGVKFRVYIKDGVVDNFHPEF